MRFTERRSQDKCTAQNGKGKTTNCLICICMRHLVQNAHALLRSHSAGFEHSSALSWDKDEKAQRGPAVTNLRCEVHLWLLPEKRIVVCEDSLHSKIANRPTDVSDKDEVNQPPVNKCACQRHCPRWSDDGHMVTWRHTVSWQGAGGQSCTCHNNNDENCHFWAAWKRESTDTTELGCEYPDTSLNDSCKQPLLQPKRTHHNAAS